MESNNQLIVRGDIFVHSSSGLYLNHGTLVLQGNMQLLTMNDGQVFNDLTIENEGIVSFANNGLNTFSVGGYLSINSGIFDITGKTVNIYQGWINAVGPDALIEENSTVVFKGFGHKYCSSEEFNNIEISSASGAGVIIMENNFVSCNSYKHTFGGGISTSGTGGGFTAYDLADPGIYGSFSAEGGAIIHLYQDDASYIDLNGYLNIVGGEIYLHGGLGDCWWPYQGNATLYMYGGVLDFTDAGIWLYDSPTYTLSTTINGGTIRTAGNFMGYRDDFNPAGGTVELYGNADVQCILIDGSNFFDLKINKVADKSTENALLKGFRKYRHGSKKPITRNNQVTMSGNLSIANDFILNNGTVTAPDNISIEGDWTNVPGPDSFIEGSSRVVFTGNSNHQYCSSEEFYTLEINKSAGDLYVASDASIFSQKLVFTAGQVEVHGGIFTVWDLVQNGIYGSYYIDGGTINLYQQVGLTGLNGDLVIIDGYFNVFGNETISLWPDYQDASIFMTGGVLNFNTGGIMILETAFEQLTADITGGTIQTAGDFIVNVDNFQPQNLTLELNGPGDTDIIIAGNNHVDNVVVYKFPPTNPDSTAEGTETNDNTPFRPISAKTGLNGIVKAIGNVNINQDLTIDNGSFDVSQYQISAVNDVNINYGTLIMNQTSGRIDCNIINWNEGSMADISEGEIHCHDWRFFENTLAQLGPGNTAFVSGLALQSEENASFGNLELGNSGSAKNLAGSRGQWLKTSGYLRQQSGTYAFAIPVYVGTDFIIEEPATFYLTSPGDILVEHSLILNGRLENDGGNIHVHGNFDFPAGGQLDNNGTMLFDRPLGLSFDLYGNLSMSDPGAVLSFLHHGITCMPTFTENITDGTIRVGSTVSASYAGTLTPQGGTLELLPFFEPGNPGQPYLFFSNGNHVHNLLVNTGTTSQYLQTNLNIKGDLTINSGQFWSHLGNIDIEGNWTNNVENSFHHGNRLVSFTGTGPSTISTNETFYNVTINKTGDGADDVVVGSGRTVKVENNLQVTVGTMELNSSSKLDIGNNLTLNHNAGLNAGGEDVNVSINIGGKWTDNNTSATSMKGFYPGTSTVVFDGSSDQEVISGGASESFYKLEIDKSSGNFIPSTNLIILNDLLLTNGLFYNLVDRSHQVHRNLSIQPGGQMLPYGTFTFAGSATANFQDQGSATSFFENVIINKETELNLLNQMTLLNGGDMNIQNGTLFTNGSGLHVSGDAVIGNGGKLSMDGGSVLKVGAGQVLDVANGGSIESIGAAGDPCMITHFSDGFYEFNINPGASISSENTIFEFVGQRFGVYIHPEALVDPVHSFHGCTFRNGDPQVQDAALISFENEQEITVNDAVFVSGSTDFNASKENGAGHVSFINATGDFASEAFENDPAGLIDWIGGSSMQSIMLPQGWSGLSAYVLPEPDDVEMIFDPIVSDLTILQNNTGMYYPGQSINTIGNWASQSAFKIKMLNPAPLEVYGSLELNQNYSLVAGWNLVPVICNSMVDAQALFGASNVTVAKEIAGTGIFWPEYGINTLINLLPGQAYYALAGSAGSIQFPAYAKNNSQKEESTSRQPAHPWNDIGPTPSSHLIAFTAKATEDLQPGDVIGVFSPACICCGVIEITVPGQATALTAFADDQFTNVVEGFDTGDAFRFELFRPEFNEFFDLEPIFDRSLPNGANFENEGLSSIVQLKLSPSGIDQDSFSGINIYPNPTNGELWIEGIGGMSDVEVLNILGETLGRYPVNSKIRMKIDLSEFQAGIYQIKISSRDGLVQRKVVKK
jgi:hypothetical protein